MDFKEKSEHYFRIAFAMKKAGKSEDAIEDYLRKEELDHNEVFLIMDRLDNTDSLPPLDSSTSSGGSGMGKKLVGIPMTIIGAVLVVMGIGLLVLKLLAGNGFDKGYILGIVSMIVGVVFFIQARGSRKK